MSLIKLISIFFLSIAILPKVQASVNLNVKIGQVIGGKVVEVTKTIRADYDKEIVISSAKLKNKFIVNLKKFDDLETNGTKVSPVQVDIKLVNEMQKTVGHPQTVTSFYNRTAQFAVHSSGSPSDPADINVSLSFEETN
jgi:hypothetical protein